MTVQQALESTAGRTIFVCMHAYTARVVYHAYCEVCWDCRSVRRPPFDAHWAAVTRIQHPDRTMTSLDGRPVAADWHRHPR